MHKGVIFYLIGGEIRPYYYRIYSGILQEFGLNPNKVFQQIAKQTGGTSQWKGKKITVKLAIQGGKITSTKIALYPIEPK